MRKGRDVVLTAVVAVLMALGVAACGSSGDDAATTGSGTAAATSTAAASDSAGIDVPADVKSKGFLDVEAVDNYPPYTYADDNGKMTGFEVQLIDAISAKMGVQPRWKNMQFDAMIPAIANRRNDLMVMGMGDTPERRKQVDFIDLYRTKLYVMTQKGNPSKLDSSDLCGRKMAATSGGFQLTVLNQLSKDCVAAGKAKIDILTFSDASQEYLAVTNKRVEGDLVDGPNGAYFVKTNPKWELVPNDVPIGDVQYTGWIINKDNAPLKKAMIQSIDALIKDGTWGKIMEENGITDVALQPPLVNGGQPATAFTSGG